MFRNVLFTNDGKIARKSIEQFVAMTAETATDITCYFVMPREGKWQSAETAPQKSATGAGALPDRSEVNEWIKMITELAATAHVRCKAYCVSSDSPEKIVFAAAERYGCDAIAIAKGDTDDITLFNLQI